MLHFTLAKISTYTICTKCTLLLLLLLILQNWFPEIFNSCITKRCMFTLEIAEWKSTISFPRRLPNLLRTSLCQESYFKLTLDCTLYKNINHIYYSYSDYITRCKREETNVKKQMYSTFPNWTMMGPISFWVSDVSKVFLEDLHDQMSKMKSKH